MKKKLTFELVAAEIQLHQIRKLSQGFGDAPCERDQQIGENKLVSGDWPLPKNEKSAPASWLPWSISSCRFCKFPRDAGMFPAAKGAKKKRNSDGQWALTTTKNKNCTCQLVVLEHQHFQVL
jgi:hypothetical protein